MQLSLKSKFGALLVAASFMTTSSFADLNFDNEQCEASIDHDISLHSGSVIIGKDGQTRFRIDGDDDLYIAGEPVELDAEQRGAVASYSKTVRKMVPEIASVVGDAVELSLVAVTEAVGGLLGEDNEKYQRIYGEFADLGEQIEEHINENGLHGSELEKHFDTGGMEDELANLLGEVSVEIAGEVAKEVVVAALRGDDAEVSRLEQKMEAWAEDLEANIEAKAESIEQNADKLCARIQEFEDSERNLAKAVPELAPYLISSDSAE